MQKARVKTHGPQAWHGRRSPRVNQFVRGKVNDRPEACSVVVAIVREELVKHWNDDALGRVAIIREIDAASITASLKAVGIKHGWVDEMWSEQSGGKCKTSLTMPQEASPEPKAPTSEEPNATAAAPHTILQQAPETTAEASTAARVAAPPTILQQASARTAEASTAGVATQPTTSQAASPASIPSNELAIHVGSSAADTHCCTRWGSKCPKSRHTHPICKVLVS